MRPEQASYNFWMAAVIFSAPVMVCWLPGTVIGGLIGRREGTGQAGSPASRRQPSAAPPPAGPAQPPARDEGLPDWRHADNPRLSLGQIGERMRAIAGRAGIPERVLPHLGPTGATEGDFIDLDKFDYIYIGLERGAPMFEHRVVVADQLMYYVFKDRAWMHAAGYTTGNPAPPTQVADRIIAGQQAILAALDPRWGAQFMLERARTQS